MDGMPLNDQDTQQDSQCYSFEDKEEDIRQILASVFDSEEEDGVTGDYPQVKTAVEEASDVSENDNTQGTLLIKQNNYVSL